MNRLQDINNKLTQVVPVKVRIDPLNELHLPSLLLGLTITTILVPILNLLLGTVISSLVILIRYLIIIGTVIGVIVLIVSRTKENVESTSSVKNLDKKEENIQDHLDSVTINDHDEELIDHESTITKLRHREPEKEDFEKLKYYDIPITKSDRYDRKNIIDKDDPYQNFVNMAQTKR